MKITIYQKDQGAHKTTWKEFATYNSEDYDVVFLYGFIQITHKIPSKYTDENNIEHDFLQYELIFSGGGENFYFTKE